MDIRYQISQLQAIQDDLNAKYYKASFLPPDDAGKRISRPCLEEEEASRDKWLTKITEAQIAVHEAIEALKEVKGVFKRGRIDFFSMLANSAVKVRTPTD